MKQKTIILVDGENVSANNAEKIVTISNRLGVVAERKVYHHQKDQGTRAWTEKSKDGNYKDIQLYGDPEKDKVDRKIQKDARRYLSYVNLYIRKVKSKEKIDGIVAAIMALDRCIRNQTEPKGSVYDERGLLVL